MATDGDHGDLAEGEAGWPMFAFAGAQAGCEAQAIPHGMAFHVEPVPHGCDHDGGGSDDGGAGPPHVPDGCAPCYLMSGCL